MKREHIESMFNALGDLVATMWEQYREQKEEDKIKDIELEEAINDLIVGCYVLDLDKLQHGCICIYQVIEKPLRETSDTSTKEVHVLTTNSYMRPRDLVKLSDYSYTIARPVDADYEIVGENNGL